MTFRAIIGASAMLLAGFLTHSAVFAAENLGYSDWRIHDSGHFLIRVYRYLPHPRSRDVKEQYYVYLNRRSPHYKSVYENLGKVGGFMYNPRTDKVWGFYYPDGKDGLQYSLLNEPVDWARVPTMNASDFPTLGPMPQIPPDDPGEPLGPVLTTPDEPLPPDHALALVNQPNQAWKPQHGCHLHQTSPINRRKR